MRVLLTGAAGFIGSHLARLLVIEGHHVVAILRPETSRWRLHDVESKLEILWGDFGQMNGLRRALDDAAPDICLHLGWGSHESSARSNVDSAASSLLLLRAVIEQGCRRVVVAGSSWEYEASNEPLAEESAVNPHDLYGVAKHAVHAVTAQLARLEGASLAWLRIFNTYGTYEDDRRLIPSIVRALLKNQVAATTGGEQVRDYTHVEDVASVIWEIGKSTYEGPINVASGVMVAVRDVAITAARLLGKADQLRLGALPYRAGEPMKVLADVRRLHEVIKWAPRYDLETGLAHTVRWLRERYSGASA